MPSTQKATKDGIDPCSAGTEELTDFFHHLYSQDRTIDQAKSSLVTYFNKLGVVPNPAQDPATRRYIVGLQKYNKQNNVDEKKPHPLTVQELSTLMNIFACLHPFLGAMLRLLLAVGFVGCFRMSEVLALRWNDVQLVTDSNGRYLSVRLRWHKKASVEEDSQVYHLVDEMSFPCLRACLFYEEYILKIRTSGQNMATSIFVFPKYAATKTGIPRIDWSHPLDQNSVRKTLGDTVERTLDLPIGKSLHSLRRGGSFYLVFVSKECRFNFRELMAWCRWADAKTCCEYLIIQSISNEIDPRSLLRTGHGESLVPWQSDVTTTVDLTFTVDDLGRTLAKLAATASRKASGHGGDQAEFDGRVRCLEGHSNGTFWNRGLAAVVRGRPIHRLGLFTEELNERDDTNGSEEVL
ncbi:hypothetical protein H310_03556 [Aphanomyces invadans]|uniref:Tyr recombinase domain-containing protein n=1 Tax=Aphanomyces invadans TaxID=157072 RepID=A0A024UI29_9STRA|nr:hypothetical protein H310_03556 [Aphanomyces invadans]ETW05914.1 hypothetical protein H310_03556 [Aphanomyces invadans]|eukprot:XP_008865691.1 hypothetical protein H310_03556 [Aphanomyces invadans]